MMLPLVDIVMVVATVLIGFMFMLTSKEVGRSLYFKVNPKATLILRAEKGRVLSSAVSNDIRADLERDAKGNPPRVWMVGDEDYWRLDGRIRTLVLPCDGTVPASLLNGVPQVINPAELEKHLALSHEAGVVSAMKQQPQLKTVMFLIAGFGVLTILGLILLYFKKGA